MSEPLLERRTTSAMPATSRSLEEEHSRAWGHLWEQFDIEIESGTDRTAQIKAAPAHIAPAADRVATTRLTRMWVCHRAVGTGEAYRGHIMWDELFIFPYLTLRVPVLTRGLLRYRYRRLDEARRAAREAGLKGALFPWQSGSNGREESQRIHLNPKSGRWIADNSWRQRHIGSAIAYNVWEYVQATDDRDFLRRLRCRAVLRDRAVLGQHGQGAGGRAALISAA